MNSDDKLKTRIKQQLDTRAVDADTRDALRVARQAALDSGLDSRLRAWIPATAIAFVIVLVGSAVLLRGIDDELPAIAADDLAVIASEDELELYEELEFYAWYEQEDQV